MLLRSHIVMSSYRICTVTFDHYFFDPRVRRLAEAAVDGGYDMDVVCVRQPHEKYQETCNGVHIYRVPMDRGFGRALPLTILNWCYFLLLAMMTVAWLHRKHAYTVVHVHNMPDFLVFSALVPKLLGAKVILDIQDSSPELMAVKAKGWIRTIVIRLARWQEGISVAFADHIITIGWTLEQVLLRRGVPKQKMTSVVNSADPKFFPPSLRCPLNAETFTEKRPFVLMYHGTLAERQGLDIAIRAVALASSVVPHIRLDMKGRGEHLPILKALTEELHIAEKVRFTEMCRYDEVAEFVLRGDVGIIPYRKDGYMELVLPTKAFEFAWMQRPMISADMPGMRSLFRAHSVAFCEPSNPGSFAAAIVDLYTNAERRIQMVQDAEEDYQAYRWEIMAARYQQVLSMLSLKMA